MSRAHFWKHARKISAFYHSRPAQFLVAFLLMANFGSNLIEAQFSPGEAEGSEKRVYDVIEVFFAVVFTIELAVNMISFWFKRFWTSPWNVFDFVMVLLSLLLV